MVSSSANGSTGPDALAAGLASIFGATGGLSEQTGYVDGPPTEIGESTDYRSANAMAVAILAGLLHRARTGQGQHIDLASREVVVASSPDALLAHQLGVDWDIRIGNTHREMFPHDVYAAADDDDWVAVAVGDDEEWAALCGVLDRRGVGACLPNRRCDGAQQATSSTTPSARGRVGAPRARRSRHCRPPACRRWR